MVSYEVEHAKEFTDEEDSNDDDEAVKFDEDPNK